MEQRSFNAFGGAGFGSMDRQVRRAIAQNLARIYADVLREPLPGPLRQLLQKLEERRG